MNNTISFRICAGNVWQLLTKRINSFVWIYQFYKVVNSAGGFNNPDNVLCFPARKMIYLRTILSEWKSIKQNWKHLFAYRIGPEK